VVEAPLPWLSSCQAKTPFRTRPSWPKMLFVPDGLEVNLNPEAFAADQLIVTGLISSCPAEPGGLVTAERPVAGPSQRMSKDTTAPTDTGVWNRNKALGMLKKSRIRRFAAVIRAVPAPRWTATPPSGPAPPLPPDGSGRVQNKPCG
jgi:hypothetical protein